MKPLLLESCLALRDVALQEANAIGRAWACVKAAVITQPRLGRAKLDIEILRQAVPELFEFGHPWVGPSCVAIESRYSPTHEQERALLKLLEVPVHITLEDVLLKEYLGNPAPLMWDHGGKCACGRRTFLFGQCDKCARDEAQDRHQEELQRALESQEEAPDDVFADPESITHSVEFLPGPAFVQDDWVRACAQMQHALKPKSQDDPPWHLLAWPEGTSYVQVFDS